MVWKGLGLVCSGATLAVVLAVAMAYRRKRGKETEKEGEKAWRRVGRLAEIYLYPLKSGKPLKPHQGKVTTLGLAELDRQDGLLPLRDRFLVLFNRDNGQFVTVKKIQNMVRLGINSIGRNAVEITFPEREPYKLELPKLENGEGVKKLNIEMYDKELVETLDCGEGVGSWLSDVLQREGGSKLTLGLGLWDSGTNFRRDFSGSKYSKLYNKLRKQDTGAYSDMSSFLLLNASSVDDLRSRVESKERGNVSALNFRPNLVVEGPKPYEEDNWDWIRIGESAVFRNFKPCTRCSATTIDPETGVRNSQMEPLKTLKKYRQLDDPVLREVEGSSPVMGIYVGVYGEGIVKIGDPVYVA